MRRAGEVPLVTTIRPGLTAIPRRRSQSAAIASRSRWSPRLSV